MRKHFNQTAAKMLQVLQILCCGGYARSAPGGGDSYVLQGVLEVYLKH